MDKRTFLKAPSQHTDEELIHLVSQNESFALAELYDRYSMLVYSFALKTFCDRATAEEIVQEVYTKVWRSASKFDPQRGTLLSWLVGITHHQCIDELRRRRIRPTLEDDASIEKTLTDDTDPYDPLMQTFKRQEVLHALELIPQEQRLVIESAFFQGLTQSEIATQLDLPLGTIKTRLRLGLQKLRDLLKEI